ncbi:MAG: Vitamin B12 dependent methionine synthase activation subunit [Ruminococcaceae bacterium]|nr:Vitamin B12 dependent methionine synthase activation subunit [Oscillospiraceae bacterium]
MSFTVYTKAYSAPEYNKKDILRYAGVREASEDITALLEDALSEADGKFTYKVCYAEMPIFAGENELDLTFTKTSSKNLQKNLEYCDSIILFSATVGLEIDRLIARYSKISPARALMLQAIGAERIESLCDFFNDDIKKEKKALGKFTHPRFSPGYGDLPIEIQKDIFRALDCPRKIGLTLNENLLMSPTKSVSAIIGIGNS